MRQFSVTIDTANAAFGDEPQYEIGRILRTLAEQLEEFPERIVPNGSFPLRDKNGNTVGLAVLRPER